MVKAKAKRVAITLGLTAACLAGAVPAAQASVNFAAQPAAPGLYVGEALWVLYNNSPLRYSPCDTCKVEVYMPATKSLGPGGGWVTLEWPDTNGWCEVNWRGNIGWTGCWRLGVLV
jgi:hypothetical protein